MDNRTVANWLLCEGYDYISESFKDVVFPIKVHTNVVEIAKNLVTEKLSKLTDDGFKSQMETMKQMGVYPAYLKAKSLSQLIDIAKNELDKYKIAKTYDGNPVKNGIMTFSDQQDFETTLSNIFTAISHQIEEELWIDLSETKLSKLSGLSKRSPKASKIYEIIASEPKVYGTIAKA